eukprot:15337586-Heterocapsa_arctica.AAC.1
MHQHGALMTMHADDILLAESDTLMMKRENPEGRESLNLSFQKEGNMLAFGALLIKLNGLESIPGA